MTTKQMDENDREQSLATTDVETAVDEALDGLKVLDRLEALESKIAMTAGIEVEVIAIEPYGREDKRQFLLRIDGLLYRATPQTWASPGSGGNVRSVGN